MAAVGSRGRPSALPPRASASPSSTRAGSSRSTPRWWVWPATTGSWSASRTTAAIGGVGSALLQLLSDEGVTTPFSLHGIPQEFLHHAERQAILDRIGLNAQTIARGIVERLAAEGHEPLTITERAVQRLARVGGLAVRRARRPVPVRGRPSATAQVLVDTRQISNDDRSGRRRRRPTAAIVSSPSHWYGVAVVVARMARLLTVARGRLVHREPTAVVGEPVLAVGCEVPRGRRRAPAACRPAGRHPGASRPAPRCDRGQEVGRGHGHARRAMWTRIVVAGGVHDGAGPGRVGVRPARGRGQRPDLGDPVARWPSQHHRWPSGQRLDPRRILARPGRVSGERVGLVEVVHHAATVR